jgi:hypothetical protein
MKTKPKNSITFSETVNIKQSMEIILSLIEFTTVLYEEEGIDTESATEEANRLIFSKPFYALSGRTIAQWIASGGEEKKVQEVVKDLVVEAVKANKKQTDQKTILARVFRN